jgi:transposase
VRIAEVIARQFGVTYHWDHVGRLMQSLGWSHQKPERLAVEGDEAAIAHGKRVHWPRIKRTAWLGAHLVFTNGSGSS